MEGKELGSQLCDVIFLIFNQVRHFPTNTLATQYLHEATNLQLKYIFRRTLSRTIDNVYSSTEGEWYH